MSLINRITAFATIIVGAIIIEIANIIIEIITTRKHLITWKKSLRISWTIKWFAEKHAWNNIQFWIGFCFINAINLIIQRA